MSGQGVAFESVDARLIRAYQLPPFMLSHYRANAALRQKVGLHSALYLHGMVEQCRL